MTDSGLACHLAGFTDLSDSPMRGALLETRVRQNISSILSARLPAGELFYWRTQGGKEVDFVVETGRHTVAIEVMAGAGWSGSDISVLEEFMSVTPGCKAAVIAHNWEEILQIGERIRAIPLGLLLS